MTKLKASLFSLEATGRLGKLFSFAKRQGRHIIERRPIPTDAKSPAQLFDRLMFTKCVDLWHLLSEAEQSEWESLARPRHMTGYAWYISQCLRPNPGIYLPLQGGTMQGIITMDGFEIEDLKDPVAVQDADTKAARDAAIALALEDCIDSHIHGWDGANWQKLKVESAAQHNLRVKIYDGTSGLDLDSASAHSWTTPGRYGAHTLAHISMWLDANTSVQVMSPSYLGDGDPATRILPTAPWIFNGATWDRPRSYPTGILKVGRAEIDSTTVIKAAVGLVAAGSRKLFWVACNPSAGNSNWELTDAVAAAAAVVYPHFDTTRDSHHIIFDPPMKFSNGIYLETFANMTSLVFCYI